MHIMISLHELLSFVWLKSEAIGEHVYLISLKIICAIYMGEQQNKLG